MTFDKQKILDFVRALPRPPEYATALNINDESKYQTKANLKTYTILIERYLRADYVRIYDEHFLIAEYIDQYHQYHGKLADNDWMVINENALNNFIKAIKGDA